MALSNRPARSRPLAAPPKLPLTFVAAFCAGLAAPPPAEAQTAEATPLAEITTTATRTERRVDAVPLTVTVTTAREAEARSARDLKDLFRYEVDLSVRAASPRFSAALGSTGRAGNEGINIRGLEGNQVLLVVDGIRLPQAFSFGAFGTGRLEYLSIDTMQAVEVLRGPAGTQFGSDGLAGAVALRTVEPADVLHVGRSFGAFVHGGADSVDDTRVARAATAFRVGSVQALLLVAARRSSETQNQGSNTAENASRTAANPLAIEQASMLAKLRWALTPTQQLGATFEGVQRKLEADLLSARSAPPLLPTSVLKLDARDRTERQRASVEWKLDDLNATFVQQAEARLYVQDAKTTQLSLEDRNTAADRVRDNRYRERIVGLNTQAVASLPGQRLSAGIEASQTQVTALRDGSVPPFGETFPTRPFPDTDYRVIGAFAQSEWELGALTLIPALRLDRYDLEPDAAGYSGGAVVALSDQAATPRFGALWRITPALTPYAQWSRGFRAPTPEQVNNGFTNVPSGYRSIGNPDLKAERAESIELGLRGELGSAGGPHGALRWQIAAYDNRYRDFISQELVSGSFTLADPAVFQYINLAQARIRGTEARVRWQIAPGWLLRAAAAATRGTSTRNGVVTRLATIEPAKASFGVLFEAGAWAWRADALLVRAKAPGDIAAATPPSFAPPSYTTLDVGASYQPWPGLTLNLNVSNLADDRYWRWSDVRGVSSTSPALDAFTAPGRSVALSARFAF